MDSKDIDTMSIDEMRKLIIEYDKSLFTELSKVQKDLSELRKKVEKRSIIVRNHYQKVADTDKIIYTLRVGGMTISDISKKFEMSGRDVRKAFNRQNAKEHRK